MCGAAICVKIKLEATTLFLSKKDFSFLALSRLHFVDKPFSYSRAETLQHVKKKDPV